MEKILENGDVEVSRVIRCTPQQLRVIADRLDLAANQRAFPREKCLYSLANGIMLEYEPLLTRNSLENKIKKEASDVTNHDNGSSS